MTDEKKAEVVIDDEMKEVFNISEQPIPSQILIKKDDTIEVVDATVLDAADAPVVRSDITPINIDAQRNKQIDDDFQYARKNIYDVIEIGKRALENLAELAESAQNPRGHEVVGQLMQNITDSTRELIELHKTMKVLKAEDAKTNEKNVTNNNLILTTDELLKMIKNQKT